MGYKMKSFLSLDKAKNSIQLSAVAAVHLPLSIVVLEYYHTKRSV